MYGFNTESGPSHINWCGYLLHCAPKGVELKFLVSRNGRKCTGDVSYKLQ